MLRVAPVSPIQCSISISGSAWLRVKLPSGNDRRAPAGTLLRDCHFRRATLAQARASIPLIAITDGAAYPGTVASSRPGTNLTASQGKEAPLKFSVLPVFHPNVKGGRVMIPTFFSVAKSFRSSGHDQAAIHSFIGANPFALLLHPSLLHLSPPPLVAFLI